MSDYENILLDVSDDVATITFNRPDALNALTAPLLVEARDVLNRIASGRLQARAVILTGAGRAFCAGADLDQTDGFNRPREQRDAGAVLESHYHPFLMAMRNTPAPIISAVKGPCAGAGMSIALSADMIIAGESAFFLQAFKAIGLVPDAGATYILPRVVGRARAMELSMLGERLPAATALAWGLVNRVVADDAVLTEAQTLAKALAAGPTRALALTRELYWLSETAGYEEQLNHERRLQREASKTEDSEEGVKAFLEKRPAQFKGR